MAFHRIGILDSGIGGLTVRESVLSLIPGISTVYIADKAYMPWGNRTREQIVQRVLSLISFLVTRRVQAVVVACNTATVAGITTYRQMYPGLPIVGVVPVVKTAAEMTGTGSFVVLSTAKTNDSPYLTELIATHAPACSVARIASPSLAALIETGDLDSQQLTAEIGRIASLVPPQADVIALGCTHYPFVAGRISAAVGRKITVIDSGGAVARQTARILSGIPDADRPGDMPPQELWTTGDEAEMERLVAGLGVTGGVVKHADIP